MNSGTVKYLYLLTRLITAVIFLWSGIAKMLDPEAFFVTIDAFGLLPEALVHLVVYLLPVLEIILSLLLFFEVKGSLSMTAVLMLLFIILLSYGIHMGLEIDCGCFGAEDPEKRAFSGLKSALFRDIGMMAGILFMFYYRLIIKNQED